MLRANDENSDFTPIGSAVLPGPSESVCLHELFERQVDALPERVAIVCGAASFSYAEIEARANRLAHYLRRRDARPGKLIGLYFERSELPIIAVLACLKAGSAYVPIDPIHPEERIRYILGEAEVEVLLTEQALVEGAGRMFAGTIISLDGCSADIAAQPTRRLSRRETGLSPDDLCYVIYTSGTTGRPKGVMTEHRNAAQFVTAFNAVCKTTPEDRIFQGFPLGFDGSVEEIWMAFSNGATLVVGTSNTPRFGEDLAGLLSHHGVTYFSTVPTMLSTISAELPSLRQVVVSGEVCPQELVTRWARPGRLMLNVYGPTEATVNSTVAICEAGRPITIGRPLPGYTTFILDADLRAVSPGVKGELYIGGIGVARGYLNQPELTARQFVTSPHDGTRLYRTGDLACFNDRGEIEFFGRIDSQVKIRGYRVELAEIEAVLREAPHIASAAVRPHERGGVLSLAAYVVLAEPTAVLDRTKVLTNLRARLPAYMIPAYLDVLEALPMLANGKVDRAGLPSPVSPLVGVAGSGLSPASSLEADIANVWADVLGHAEIGAEQDFFRDLGGHSLLAAQMVGLLRKRTGRHVAVRDIYSFPTIRTLAAYLEDQPQAAQPKATDRPAVHAGESRAPHVAATVLQAVVIVMACGLLAMPVVGLTAAAEFLDALKISRTAAAALLAGWLPLQWLVMLAVSIAAKWAIIGRYRAGVYPLWGSYYIRWWIVSRLQGISGANFLVGTPLMAAYYRLMGARIGRYCALETAHCSIFDLVSIGDDTSIGADTQLLGYRIENGLLLLGRVDVGNRCFVGVHSALGLDVRMDDDARLDDQSLLRDGETMREGEQRRGSPACAAEVTVPTGKPLRPSLPYVAAFATVQFVLASFQFLLMGLPFLAFLWIALDVLDGPGSAALYITVLLPPFVVVYCLWIALLRALWLPRAKPGVFALYSMTYLRHWLAGDLMRTSRAILLPLFTTIYLPPWMRLLGAKLGRGVEMSTVSSSIPDLLSAGDGSFFADGCILGGRRVYAGRFEVRANRVGERSFVGNSAILPPGAGLGDNCLLGVLSAPPSRTDVTPDDTDWLGSPAFRLPNREKVGGFDERTTFRPTATLYLQRAIIDACRIFVPFCTILLMLLAAVAALDLAYKTHGWLIMIATAWLLSLVLPLVAVLIVVALKWVVMGRFRPVIVPLWSPYVWLNEMINGAYESLMAPVIALLFGTPFAAPLLRVLGCRVGRHCYIGTSLFSEFDLVEIGHHAALNAGAIIQTHLFEDRIMKSSYLRIGDECSVGNMAVVLYDTRMERGAILGPLSLLMKGETEPAGSRWHGIPTVEG